MKGRKETAPGAASDVERAIPPLREGGRAREPFRASAAPARGRRAATLGDLKRTGASTPATRVARSAAPAADAAERAKRAWQVVVANQLNIILVAFDRTSEVARMLGVSPSQMTRWQKNAQLPDAANRDRIRRLADTVGLLLQRYRPGVVADWFRAPGVHAMDGGGTPADLVRAGRWDVLRAYAEEAASESYG